MASHHCGHVAAGVAPPARLVGNGGPGNGPSRRLGVALASGCGSARRGGVGRGPPLAAQGARLCLLARDAEELARAREQLPADADVLTIRCDVRRRADVRAAMAAVLEKWTAVDVLINNAGIIQVGPFDHQRAEDYDAAMKTHFWGPLYTVLAALWQEGEPAAAALRIRQATALRFFVTHPLVPDAHRRVARA